MKWSETNLSTLLLHHLSKNRTILFYALNNLTKTVLWFIISQGNVGKDVVMRRHR